LKGENGKMKIKAEKTWIMMALLLVSVSSMIKAPNSETQEGAHALNSYSTSSAVPATEWNETYGGQSNDAAHSLVNTSDGGYALAGSTFSYGAGSFDFWLVKTDLAGTELWNKTYGGGGDDEAYSVIQTNDSGYAVAGFTNSYGNGGNDFWLVKTDSGGNKVWSQPYGGTSDDKAYCVVQANGGGYALAGSTYSISAGNDAWLVKMAAVYHTLNITVTAGGTVNPTNGTHTYPYGTVVTVTASPIAGYFFDHWELDGNSTATFNSINVSMDIDQQLKAVFAPLQCALNITVTAGGTTDPTPGTHTYPYGQFANVTAYPDYGNYLDHWVVDGVDTNSTSNPIHVPMHMNHTLNAVFRCPHDIAVINIAAQKTCVGQNQSTNINYTVANVGKSYEVFVITLYTNFTENSSETVLAFIQVSLVSGYNLSSTLPWSTSGFSKGNYTLIGSVEPVGNETITADNTFVSGSILVTIPGDLNGDLRVTLSDLVILANAYGSTPGDIKWNPDSDINGNGKVDLPDLVILALNYGKTDP
jgi:hypothetical protein